MFRTKLYSFYLLLTVCGFFSSTCYGRAEDQLTKLLPKKSLRVDVLDFRVPPDVQTIIQNMKAALQEHPEILQTAKAGEPLPYSSKMGVSESDYQKILHVQDYSKLEKAAEVQLSVDVKKNSTVMSI